MPRSMIKIPKGEMNTSIRLSNKSTTRALKARKMNPANNMKKPPLFLSLLYPSMKKKAKSTKVRTMANWASVKSMLIRPLHRVSE